jgi:glycosyltransferase involved in cell wall biosynthesis
MSRKRLAIVASHPIQYQTPWFRALARHPDLDVHVFFCHRATPEEQSEAGFGVAFEWDIPLLEGYPHAFLRNVAKAPRVTGFFGLDTPDVEGVVAGGSWDAALVLGWQHKSYWQAIRACWKTRTPVMVRGDSHLHTERPRWKSAVKWLPYRRFVSKLDACLAVGTWSREYFLRYGARPERIFCVPHTIDTDQFVAQVPQWEQGRGALQQRWRLDRNAEVFLFVGKMIGRKRPLDYVQAIHLAVQQGARVAGLMVGEGPLRRQCERYIWDHHVPIQLAGFVNQSEIVQAYLASGVLVVPSDGRETWGLVVNEAMACGRPCVVSDRVGCGPDLVVAGETGHIFPMGDVDRLAEIMTEYGKRRDHVLTMGKAACERIGRFTPEAAADAVAQAVDAVTTGAG